MKISNSGLINLESPTALRDEERALYKYCYQMKTGAIRRGIVSANSMNSIYLVTGVAIRCLIESFKLFGGVEGDLGRTLAPTSASLGITGSSLLALVLLLWLLLSEL